MASLLVAPAIWGATAPLTSAPGCSRLPQIDDLRLLAHRLAHNATDGHRRTTASAADRRAVNSTNGTACRVARGLHGVLLELEGSAVAAASVDAAEKAAAMTRLSGEASVTACAGRARRDIAESAAADVATMMGTEWATTIIKTIAMPLIMSFLTPFILQASWA